MRAQNSASSTGWVYPGSATKCSTSVDDWLGPQPEVEPLTASIALLRRYLSCYGPSRRKDFADWAGMAPTDAGLAQAWEDLVEVAFGRRTAWLFHDDLDPLRLACLGSEVRLLPLYDRYLLLRDRETLAPDKTERSTLWRAVGNPGAVILGGVPIGAWRSQPRGKRLQVTVETFEPFEPIPGSVAEAIQHEADAMADLRGSTVAEVRITART